MRLALWLLGAALQASAAPTAPTSSTAPAASVASVAPAAPEPPAVLPLLDAAPALPCWIEGRWFSESREGGWTEENWTGCRAQTMLGTGRGGRAETVTSYEYMRIARNENGDLMFYGSPFGNPAAAFRAVKAGPGEIVFVNPNHSYPQRIRYWVEGDQLLTEASMIDGSKPQAWRYNRLAGK